ncbi:restriction endonuclease [Sporomusa sp. KB1]|jgi:restriction system protein|uniref:restriction endonuclease n=1 Tax=Sporomusa sp. KB1 TaxID=943346 RepID=UPI00119FC2A0|nr:restriction endonuclease [Sporomusa sp. KB1]TWH48500.1 restriction system protein [Sporomusa sp. KB1]
MANQTWRIEVRHAGLNKYREIKGADKYVVEQKAAVQMAAWEEMWQKKLDRIALDNDRRRAAQEIADKKQNAIDLTLDAEESLKKLDNLLLSCLENPPTVYWDKFKNHSSFSVDLPKKVMPTLEEKESYDPEPMPSDAKYTPRLGFIDQIFSKRRKEKEDAAKLLYETEHETWKNLKESIEKRNQEKEDQYQKELIECEAKYNRQIESWNKQKEDYDNTQSKFNADVDQRKNTYVQGLESGVNDLIDIVLSESDYPDSFPQEYDYEYNLATKMLVIDYILPAPNHLPTLKEVKYIQSKDEFKETHLSESAIAKIYDEVLYKITLRTIFGIYSADKSKYILSIAFNGWVNSVDRATGNDVKACVLSIQANRDEFAGINLELVDPKICFKKLKGIGSSKLHSLSPIAPILRINREDSRFISSYDVADTLDDTTNLAAMDWQDFEHLIRELFEKEFSVSGGEVKITQASKDGGVDAVVFDPDPIRGGKIVIQAKRYTNTVGLSAVRDLYGTVVNEGAIKGILVSTADYGPDAYNFSKDKPITLLDGSNLLHLLQKHGHKAKIDLREAKQIIADQKNL